MKKVFIIIILTGFISHSLFAQFEMKFGDIKSGDLSNKPYSVDPGADAVILSDIGVAKLNYNDGFYVELERDVKIRMINSNGFNYADVEIPYSSEDQLLRYRASTFNLRNGEKIETKIPSKSFIRERSTRYKNVLKFNFPDVHEGTVIEYSYILRLKGQSLHTLTPWIFQNSIPIVFTSISVVYPEFFTYKTNISGNPLLVKNHLSEQTQYFGSKPAQTYTSTWYAENVPAFKREPFVKSARDNQTILTFELGSVNFPGASRQEISPTYENLTEKLLERDDFGSALSQTLFLKKTAEEITKDLQDEVSKVRAVHKYVSEQILWDGTEDYTSSSKLKTVFTREKGNSAEINMIFISMLRNLNINADPVILSTRSNGIINQISAMYQQFNYLVANVTIDGKDYLIDATDPLRTFDMLPFECLNGMGRLINKSNSKFVNLRNSEKSGTSLNLKLSFSEEGNITGNLKRRKVGYTSLDARKQIKLEGKEGYEEIFKENYSNAEIDDFSLLGTTSRDSDIVETCKIKIKDAFIDAGQEILIDPFFSFSPEINFFSSPQRSFPVDFGCPVENTFSLTLQIPDQYEIKEKPVDVRYDLGNNCTYKFTFSKEGNNLIIKSNLNIGKTSFPTSEYSSLRDFFAKVVRSQDRLIVLRKKLS